MTLRPMDKVLTGCLKVTVERFNLNILSTILVVPNNEGSEIRVKLRDKANRVVDYIHHISESPLQ